jgi:Flp pilus assembly protein CpaB
MERPCSRKSKQDVTRRLLDDSRRRLTLEEQTASSVQLALRELVALQGRQTEALEALVGLVQAHFGE